MRAMEDSVHFPKEVFVLTLCANIFMIQDEFYNAFIPRLGKICPMVCGKRGRRKDDDHCFLARTNIFKMATLKGR